MDDRRGGQVDRLKPPRNVGGTGQHGILKRSQTTLTRETSFYEDDGSESDFSGSYESDSQGSYTEYTDSEYTDGSYTDYSQGSYYSEGEFSDDYTDYTDSESYRGSVHSDPSNRMSNSKRRSRGGFLPPLGGRSRTEPHVPGSVAKHDAITVYRNGDRNFKGRVVIVHPSFRTFTSLLDDITQRIRSPFGAVRRLYKLPEGKRIRDLDEISDGDHVVAARAESFKRIPYNEIMDYSTRQRTYVRPDLEKMKYHPRAVCGRNKVEHAITIFCLGNGDKDGIVTQVVLNKRDLTTWEHILDIVTVKLGYKKLTSAAKKLIDFETREHIHSIEQLQNNHFYVAIDRLDHVEWPPFRVDPESREIVPVVKRSRRKVKNMPIMFENDVIRGKIYSGESLVEKRRIRTGKESDVGKVTIRKRLIRKPRELPPIKQPFARMHTTASKVEDYAFRRMHVTGGVEERAMWRFIHLLIDEETNEVVQEVLQEMEQDLAALLNRFVGTQNSGAGQAVKSQGRMRRRSSKAAGPRSSIRDSRRSCRQNRGLARVSHDGGGGEIHASRRAEDGNIIMAPITPKAESNTPEVPDPPPKDTAGPIFEYDEDIPKFLDFMAHPNPTIFKDPQTEDDIMLEEKLTGAMKAALAGQLSHWEDGTKSVVALVILLDQIPRRKFAGRPEMYDGDDAAQKIIFRLVERPDLLHRIKPTMLLFVCIALSHHEDMKSQNTANQVWKDIKSSFSKHDAAHAERTLSKSREIIQEFGRFPNRNRILGRASNTHEQKYLERMDPARSTGTEEASRKPSVRSFRRFSRRSRGK